LPNFTRKKREQILSERNNKTDDELSSPKKRVTYTAGSLTAATSSSKAETREGSSRGNGGFSAFVNQTLTQQTEGGA